MPKVSVESMPRPLLFAAAVGVTSRRGIQLIVIGVLFSWLPFVRELASTLIAG
jgi:hypothetical protein